VDTLSMGMSADLEDAIAEGATLVRVGTAIFGARDAQDREAMTTAFIGGGQHGDRAHRRMLARGAAAADFSVVEPYRRSAGEHRARFEGVALHAACTREAIAGAALVVLA
jgi:hypothetical protein